MLRLTANLSLAAMCWRLAVVDPAPGFHAVWAVLALAYGVLAMIAAAILGYRFAARKLILG